MNRFEEWAERWHWPSPRTLVIVAIVVVVAAAAAAGGWFWYDSQQRRASVAFADVMTRVGVAEGPQASPEQRTAAMRELEQYIAQYPSAAFVPQAAYELGNLRYATRQYPAARAAYEIALARGAAGTVRTLTRASIGYTWEAEGDYAKAIDAYQGVATSLGPRDFLYEEVMLDLARAQALAGRKADAVATYRRVLEQAPDSRRADEIRAQLAILGEPAK